MNTNRWIGLGIALALAAAAPTTGSDGGGELRPGGHATLTVRWIVEDGYYVAGETTSSLTFTPPARLSVRPAKLDTSGRIIGVLEQEASIAAAANAQPGVHRVKIDAVIYFCSVRERWCKRVTRAMRMPVTVSRDAKGGSAPIELEVLVPSDDKR